ncbi:hypothetical protein DUGA2_19240 [Duganella sp. HH101]|nr:hypothetical protein DUGA2_19240 [Duganella sp. HH101]
MMSVTRFTLSTISFMVLPACATSLLPASTLSTESPISSLISLAAAAERCARLRTSVATTAKPRPCSPARAASTAAFKARMLVWNAMPSITPMMSAIFFDAALIAFMVSTTCATTAPPLVATADADAASSLAWRALSAFCLTVPVSSSIDDAVSSSELACCSVRDDRSWLPRAISVLALAMVVVPRRTSPTMLTRLWFMSPSACSIWPVSSRELASKRVLRSPAATVRAMRTARASGRTMLRLSTHASVAASAMVSRPPNTSVLAVSACSESASAARCTSSTSSASLICLSSARIASMPWRPRPSRSSASTGSMLAPSLALRRRSSTGCTAWVNHACWACTSFCSRSCWAGLSAVSWRAWSTWARNASWPALSGASAASSPVSAKPRSPVSILSRLSRMFWACAITAWVWLFQPLAWARREKLV